VLSPAGSAGAAGAVDGMDVNMWHGLPMPMQDMQMGPQTMTQSMIAETVSRPHGMVMANGMAQTAQVRSASGMHDYLQAQGGCASPGSVQRSVNHLTSVVIGNFGHLGTGLSGADSQAASSTNRTNLSNSGADTAHSDSSLTSQRAGSLTASKALQGQPEAFGMRFGLERAPHDADFTTEQRLSDLAWTHSMPHAQAHLKQGPSFPGDSEGGGNAVQQPQQLPAPVGVFGVHGGSNGCFTRGTTGVGCRV
jgi:hypothetical protein